MENSHSHSLAKKTYNGNGFAVKSVYDDVFGGPPSFGVPTLSPRVEDYREIFGTFHGSRASSIPILDLPVVDEADVFFDVRSSKFDYSEVFGGFNGLDFAVSFEELCEKSKNGGDSSEDAWTPAQSEYLSEESGPATCSEKNQSLSNGGTHQSSDGTKQFNVSYHKANQRSKEYISNGTTLVTQLSDVPGFTFRVNETMQKVEDENPLSEATIGPREEKRFRKTMSHSSKSTAGENLNSLKGYGRTSSLPNKPFVTVSDISLRTQPSELPPPARPPPVLVTKDGDLDTQKSKLKASRSYSFDGVAGNNSPPFFDVEVDASSSAAALKDAMEKAQVKLNSAKELMERKKEGLPSRVKEGLKSEAKDKEGKMSKLSNGSKSCKDEREKARGGMKIFEGEEKPKITKTTKVVSDATEGKGNGNVAKISAEEIQGKGYLASQEPNRAEGNVEWKEAAQFYEVVETKSSEVLEPQVENSRKIKAARQVHEWEENGDKIGVANGPREWNEKKGRSKVTEESHRPEKHEKKVEVAQEICGWEENGKTLPSAKLHGDVKMILTEDDKSEAQNKLNEVQQSESKVEIRQPPEEATEKIENKKRLDVAYDKDGNRRRLDGTFEREEFDKNLKEAVEQEEKQKRRKEVREREEHEKRSNEALQQEHNEKRLKQALELENTRKILKTVLDHKENDRSQDIAFERNEHEKKLDKPLEREESANKPKEAPVREENKKRLNDAHERKEKGFKEASQQEKNKKSLQEEVHQTQECENRPKEALRQEETGKRSEGACEWEDTENMIESTGKWEELKGQRKCHEESWLLVDEIEPKCDEETREKLGETEQVSCEDDGTVRPEAKNGEGKEGIVGVATMVDKDGLNSSDISQEDSQCEKHHIRTEDDAESLKDCGRKLGEGGVDLGQTPIERNEKSYSIASDPENVNIVAHERGERKWFENEKGMAAAQLDLLERQKNAQKTAQKVSMKQSAERKVKALNETLTSEAREKEERMNREKELERDRLRKIEEEREREREREKDRMAVERATCEARERAFVEARERAERAAVERATSEVKQRALADARERLEKASAEARERSLAEKASVETRLRAERAAVERATAEARERAVEKAMAEKAALEARERVERSVSDKFYASSRDGGINQGSSDLHFQNRWSSSGSRYTHSSVHGGAEGESPQRCKARLERHQRTAERAAKALAEKNMRDLLTQREQAERNRLAEGLDAEVKRWSSGKEGNLRALLSTLQYILGPDSGWQAVPLTEVITSAAVKKAYRKATLCVHPDKLQQRGATIQQKYICEKVFDLLKEAWNRFNSEER